jgi:hypothetical protein
MHRRAGNSPDLNPIEYVWSIKNARLKRDHTITFLPKLERAIKMMWVRDLSLFLFQKLAHSMPTRIKMKCAWRTRVIRSRASPAVYKCKTVCK